MYDSILFALINHVYEVLLACLFQVCLYSSICAKQIIAVTIVAFLTVPRIFNKWLIDVAQILDL